MAKKKEEIIDEILNDPTITEDLRKQIKEEAKAELAAQNKQQTREVIYEILKIFGLALLTLFVLIAFETLFEVSLFGAMFKHTDYKYFWDILSSGGYKIDGTSFSIDAVNQMYAASGFSGTFDEWLASVNAAFITPAFDDWCQFRNPWLPATIITMVMICLGVGLGLVYSIVINDVISFVKKFKTLGKNIVDLAAENITDALEENNITTKKSEKKGLFDDDDDDMPSSVYQPKTEDELKEEKRVAKAIAKAKKQKEKEELKKQQALNAANLKNATDDDLDALLKAPHTSAEETKLKELGLGETTLKQIVPADAQVTARTDEAE